MITQSNQQLDFFSQELSLWQRQTELTKNQLREQLALLLLSCLKDREAMEQLNKEKQPCPVK